MGREKRRNRLLPWTLGWIARLGLWLLRALGFKIDEHSTLYRVFKSRHVVDLRTIAGIAVLISIVISLLSFRLLQLGEFQLKDFLGLETSLLGVLIAVLAWSYQTGSARLGVVDLFACEISTLCRTALVVQSVEGLIRRFNEKITAAATPTGAPQPAAHAFTSQESYFPVFDQNAKDLQALEARVVINITAFYTFMKTMRDSLRSLSALEASIPTDDSPRYLTAQRDRSETATNAIYMLFLALERARLAIEQLVEFDPDEAERTIIVLISEMTAFRFLCEKFTEDNDVRTHLLRLRLPEYEGIIPKLIHKVETNRKEQTANGPRYYPEWEPAAQLLPDLRARFDEAMDATKTPPPAAPQGDNPTA